MVSVKSKLSIPGSLAFLLWLFSMSTWRQGLLGKTFLQGTVCVCGGVLLKVESATTIDCSRLSASVFGLTAVKEFIPFYREGN